MSRNATAPCPDCGERTRVARTLRWSHGATQEHPVRERVCTNPNCGRRLGTVEVPLHEYESLALALEDQANE